MDPNIYALVLDTLHRATSQDIEILKPAEEKLREWEIEPGFYSVLLNVFTNHTLDSNVRWLAVMCFKNGVEKYWRRTAPNSLPEEEKIKLRQGFISPNIFSEPVTQIATQQAVVIAKMARIDCPVHWPDLVPGLVSALKTPQSLVQHRALLIFHHVVKSLSTKRLINDRRTFQELTNTIYSFILNLWYEHTELFLRHIQEGATTELITEHLEKALLCLRILRKLTVYGFKKAHESQDANAFLNIVFDRAKTCVECRKLLKGRGIYPLELCEKFIIHLTKVALGVLSYQPSSYVQLIRPSLEFAIYYCFTEVGMAQVYERFTIQCLNIIKGILQCSDYKLVKAAAATTKEIEPLTLQANQAKLEVLDANTVCHMCRHLVSHYFLLSADDLALWDAEPESFAIDESGESWKYNLRPCTEALFMELFSCSQFRDVLAPEMVRLLGTLQQQQISPDDLSAILKKDAIYNAIGLASFDLYDDIDFEKWYTSVLCQELKIKDNNYRIIRRRICQLIGQWSNVRPFTSLRPVMYESLIEPLSKTEEDAAVKLAAAEALRSCIDDFNFDLKLFAPYASHGIAALYKLLVDSEESETKMHILHVVACITERCGRAVARGDSAVAVFAYMPQLWHNALISQHYMLLTAALSALVQLLKAIGECPTQVRTWMLGVVNESTNLSESAHVYLLEDALELWLAILETSPTADADTLQLAANLYPILEQSSEHMRVIVFIIQAYILLCPEEFLSGVGDKCFLILEDMLGDMRYEGVLAICKMAEFCISIDFPERNAMLGIKAIWPMVIRVICNVLEVPEIPMLISGYLSLLSRVIMISTELFFKGITEAAQVLDKYDCDPDKVFTRLVTVWTEKMNNVTQAERWKVVGLGLAALLTTQKPIILTKFPAILLNLVEVLNDVMKSECIGSYVDGLVAAAASRPVSPESRGRNARLGESTTYMAQSEVTETNDTPHEVRHRRMARLHPAYTIDLRAVTHHQLETLKSQVGEETFKQLLQCTDKETLQQIRDVVKRTTDVGALRPVFTEAEKNIDKMFCK